MSYRYEYLRFIYSEGKNLMVKIKNDDYQINWTPNFYCNK